MADVRALGVAPTAPDPKRLVCASTCMDAKFHGKPCECYPQPRNGHPAYGVTEVQRG